MNKISRKGFLKIAAAAAMSGVTAGALAACKGGAASSGAASKILYIENQFEDEKLLTDFCYLPLFDELFEEILSGK